MICLARDFNHSRTSPRQTSVVEAILSGDNPDLRLTKGTSNCASGAEEFLQQVRAFSRQHAPAHLNFVIQCRVVQDLHNRMHSASLRVVSPVDQTPNAGMHNGSGAHGAWLDGDEQIAVIETIVPQSRTCFSEGHDFGMSCWIVAADIAIETATHDLPFVNDDCSHWNLSGFERPPGGTEGLLHPEFVGFVRSQHDVYCRRSCKGARQGSLRSG